MCWPASFTNGFWLRAWACWPAGPSHRPACRTRTRKSRSAALSGASFWGGAVYRGVSGGTSAAGPDDGDAAGAPVIPGIVIGIDGAGVGTSIIGMPGGPPGTPMGAAAAAVCGPAGSRKDPSWEYSADASPASSSTVPSTRRTRRSRRRAYCPCGCRPGRWRPWASR